jgi:uncharacterized protein YcfJ
MSEPSNRELMTHIEYIRTSVDEIKGTVKAARLTAEDHEIRLVKLEERAPKSRYGVMSGGFLGGLIAGFFGSKAGGV